MKIINKKKKKNASQHPPLIFPTPSPLPATLFLHSHYHRLPYPLISRYLTHVKSYKQRGS